MNLYELAVGNEQLASFVLVTLGGTTDFLLLTTYF